MSKRGRLALVIAIGLVLFASAWALRRLADGQTGAGVTAAIADCSNQAKSLAVVVHGLGGQLDRLDSVIAITRERHPDSDLLVLRYPVGWLSNSDPFRLAASMQDAIDRQVRACEQTRGSPYDTITLVGYSAGGLLLRRAFVWAFDPTTLPRGAAGARPQQPWSRQVNRIILLAGMNRGWSLDDYADRPLAKIHPVHRWLAIALRPLAEFVGVTGFLFSLERGSPFVADLRVDWVRLATGGGRLPLVVQLLGATDQVVTERDESDLDIVSRGFVFIPAGNSDHESILQVGVKGPARDALIEALTKSDEWLLENRSKRASRPDPRIDRVVFIRHGIRDDNEWARALHTQLCARAGEDGFDCDVTAAGRKHMAVDSDGYGYLAMLPFLAERMRRDKVRVFVDRYVEQLAQAGNPDLEVDFVGHSNGTFLLADAIRRYASIRVRRVVFANSVVNFAFDWRAYSLGQGDRKPQVTGSLRNYQGTSDFVVATFPRLFEVHFSSSGLGSAGYKNFQIGPVGQDPTSPIDVLLNGGHNVGVAEENRKDIVSFLLGRGTVTNPATTSDRTWVEWLWKFPWIGWALAFLLAAGVFVGTAKLVGRFTTNLGPRLGPIVRYGVAGGVVLTILLRA